MKHQCRHCFGLVTRIAPPPLTLSCPPPPPAGAGAAELWDRHGQERGHEAGGAVRDARRLGGGAPDHPGGVAAGPPVAGGSGSSRCCLLAGARGGAGHVNARAAASSSRGGIGVGSSVSIACVCTSLVPLYFVWGGFWLLVAAHSFLVLEVQHHGALFRARLLGTVCNKPFSPGHNSQEG